MSASTPVKPATKSATSPKSRKATKAKAAPPATPTVAEISRLAEKYWTERGRPHGSPEHDWLRAERELMGKAS